MSGAERSRAYADRMLDAVLRDRGSIPEDVREFHKSGPHQGRYSGETKVVKQPSTRRRSR